MKKISIVSSASLGFLLLCSAVAIILRGIINDAVVSLIIGVVILAASGIVAFAVRERKSINILCILLSAVAMGFLLRAWYINRGFDNPFWVMTLISLSTVLYLWVFFALTKIPFVHKSKTAYFLTVALYLVLSVVAYFTVMVKTETTYVSTFGYYMIVEMAFILAMSLEVNNSDELIRNLALSTYSVFVVAIIAGVIILAAAGGGDCDCDCGPDGCCDRDCCEVCDCSGCGGDSSLESKKRKNK
ncbi:MAG: hypothetical protein J6V09_03365 [Clostridia bacterium]|nr:hypothetical protein [Clostridia bacterium]